MRFRESAGFALGVGVGLAVLFVALKFWAFPTLQDLTVEDGVLEWLTALLYFAAAAAFVVAGLRGRTPKLWVLPIGLLCFLVAGEEISWGQRLLGLSTPTALEDVNVQGETNLHNIEGIHGIVRALAVVILVSLFLLLPLAVRHVGFVRNLVDRFRFPLPPLAASLLIVIGILFMAVPRLMGDQSFELDEVGEAYVGAAWLLWAVKAWTSRPGADRAAATVGVFPREN